MKMIVMSLMLLLTGVAQAAMVCESFKTDANWSEQANASIKIFKLSKDYPHKEIVLYGNPDEQEDVVVLKADLKERVLPSGDVEEYAVFMVENHGQFIYSRSPKGEQKAFHRFENNFFTTKCY